ncbi:MAG: amino acid permease [Gammaproteobacteria bacterium]|nr:amino acid permease [Gammaproteobacteria bacterium]
MPFPDSVTDLDKKLVRGLGRLEATTLVAGGIIGTSIFLITSEIAATVGSPLLVLVTWLVAGLLAGAAALCFAELSAAMPRTGGTYVFLRRAYGSDLVSFSFAWMMCFAYGTGAIAVVAIMAATFLMPVLQAAGILEGDRIAVTAVILIAVLTVLNSRGVRQGGLTQNAITFMKIGLIAALMSVPILLGDVQFGRLSASVPDPQGPVDSFRNVGTALVVCLFSYNGAYFVTHVAEEIRDPQRNIPKAIIGGFLVVLAVYLSINAIYVTVMPFDEIVASERIASDLMGRLLGPSGSLATSMVVFCSAIGVLNAQLLNYPRIPFALAVDGLFFSKVATINPKSKAPAVAIILVGLLSSLFALTGSYALILSYVAFVIHFFICLAVLAVVVLRIREPDLPRPYKVWGYPFTPVVFLLVSVFYLGNLIVTRPFQVLVGVGIVLSGLPFYWYWQKRPANNANTV